VQEQIFSGIDVHIMSTLIDSKMQRFTGSMCDTQPVPRIE